jgi:hypothetical protein
LRYDLLCGFLVVPEVRRAHLLLEQCHLLLFGRYVKESPGWR